MRSCITCGSFHTFTNKQGYVVWYRFMNGHNCKKCHDKLDYKMNTEKIKSRVRIYEQKNPDKVKRWKRKWADNHLAEHNAKHLAWRPDKKVITLDKNPRKGICQWCGKKIGDEFVNFYGKLTTVKTTHIHHINYHRDDPLKDTVELCPSCHGKEHRRIIMSKKS